MQFVGHPGAYDERANRLAHQVVTGMNLLETLFGSDRMSNDPDNVLRDTAVLIGRLDGQMAVERVAIDRLITEIGVAREHITELERELAQVSLVGL